MEADQTQPAAAAIGVGPISTRIRDFLMLALELGLILVTVHLFEIEGRRHFFALLCIACAGFLVHAWLPSQLRPAFFVVLSLGSILFILGWPNGAWVIGLGSGLIALWHLPLSFALRVGLVVVAGCGLAVYRMGSAAPFWPILGSMFMFRLVLYVYDNRHAAARPPLLQSLGYFFTLPNICFPFFPVIDFKTFRETYRADDAFDVYQTGIASIVRGLSHLLAYRFVKYYLLPSPFDLRDVPHLLLFLATNYALYLHISGQFHIITGILQLFGFNLPRTHLHYFLASSFTDIWRRINIYWKDFMMKVFFLPAFFRLRGLGTPLAVTVATMGVFLMTWLLHSYQVFWLLGDFPIGAKDACLWLVVGVLVVINLQWDLRRQSSAPGDRGKANTMAAAVLRSLRIAGMFLLVSFFWACWTMPGFLVQLPALARNAGDVLAVLGWLVGLIVGVGAIGVLVHLARTWLAEGGRLTLPISFGQSVAAHGAALCVLVLAGTPQFIAILDDSTAEMLTNLRQESLTPGEAAQLVRGYYEEITAPRVQAGALLASMEGNRPPDPGVQYIDITRPTGDFLERELIPGWSGEVRGKRLTINQFGLRDRADRTQHKPANTCRLAVLGSSVVMGFGVGDEETFPRVVEEQLNAGRGGDKPRLELLNFGTGQGSVTQRRAVLDRKVFALEPDAVYYVAHADEFSEGPRHLAKVIARGNLVPYPSMRDVLAKAGVTAAMSLGEIDGRLKTFGRDLVLEVYREMAAECRKRGVLPVWIYLPIPGVAERSAKTVLAGLAAEAGFKVVDLTGWWEEHRPAEVLLSANDHHPNALGQRLIAQRLLLRLREQPETLPANSR